ncbi:MAG: outer membrane beta-barrel protein, partial [Sphingomicrobium sp.]
MTQFSINRLRSTFLTNPIRVRTVWPTPEAQLQKGIFMRNYLLAAVAVAAIASPAMARDGAGYVGVEGGILFPRHSNFNTAATRSTTAVTTNCFIPTTLPATTTCGPVPAGVTPPAAPTFSSTGIVSGGGFNADYKRGVDLDAIVGYDFGMFRLEGELGYKRTRARDYTANAVFLTAVNNPLGFTTPVYTTTPYTNASSQFNFNDRTTVLSGMVNGLLDFSVDPSVRAYLGGGVGRARVKTFGDRDSAWAWQFIAGLATAISPNVDLGLKYRYFQTGKLHFNNSNVGPFTGTTSVNSAVPVGTPNALTGGTVFTNTTYNTTYGFSDSGKFRSHSLLASLI